MFCNSLCAYVYVVCMYGGDFLPRRTGNRVAVRSTFPRVCLGQLIAAVGGQVHCLHHYLYITNTYPMDTSEAIAVQNDYREKQFQLLYYHIINSFWYILTTQTCI